jgi:hypothetical protein
MTVTSGPSNALPETPHARNADVHIAYQVVGEGPVTFVGLPGIVSRSPHSPLQGRASAAASSRSGYVA